VFREISKQTARSKTMTTQQFNDAKPTSDNFDAVCAQLGYTRGFTHRGRVVLTGADILVAEYDAVMWTFSAKRAFETVEAAEAYASGKRPEESATLRRIAGTLQSDAERAKLDSGY
jgi:hypothetical protein